VRYLKTDLLLSVLSGLSLWPKWFAVKKITPTPPAPPTVGGGPSTAASKSPITPTYVGRTEAIDPFQVCARGLSGYLQNVKLSRKGSWSKKGRCFF